MEIPKRFKVFDSEIKIIIDPDLILNNQCSGQYNDKLLRNRFRLQMDIEQFKASSCLLKGK